VPTAKNAASKSDENHLYRIIYDPLSKNLTSLHNSALEVFAIEILGAKYTRYKNNFTHFNYFGRIIPSD